MIISETKGDHFSSVRCYTDFLLLDTIHLSDCSKTAHFIYTLLHTQMTPADKRRKGKM